MGLLLRRREMMLAAQPTPPTPILPSGYTQVEYIQYNPAGSYDTVYSLEYQLNGVDTVEVRAGFMATATQHSSSGGYIVGCRQTTSNNTIGFGVLVNQGATEVNCFDGTSNRIYPNGGNSIVNQRIDVVATKTPTGTTITDGTDTNSVTSSPRNMATTLWVFGTKQYNYDRAQVVFTGRIYYLKVNEAGATVIDLVPCRKTDNTAFGFYDIAQNRFINTSNSRYSKGPDV